MTADNLDVRLLGFRARRQEAPHVLAAALLEAGRIPEALEVVQLGIDTALLVAWGGCTQSGHARSQMLCRA